MKFPYKIIDLTHTLTSNTPTWNADCGFKHVLDIDYTNCEGDEKFRVMKLSMYAGTGTHLDAPSHCVPGGKYIHELDINNLCMPCFVIDVSGKCFANYSVSKEDILNFEHKFGFITENSCVMFKTGWSKFWDTPEKYHNNHLFPSVSAEAAELLLQRNVSALGIDTLSPDRPINGFKVHQLFLSAGKLLIENVANLDNMPPFGAFIMALPIKIQDGTEAPVRLIGLIER